jgi:hypothetical protein
LLNPKWSEAITSFTDGSGYEASSVFRRINEDIWNVGNVNYSSRFGFHFHTADACLRNLKAAPDLSGHVSPQHGSFIHINKTEYDLLQTWSDLKAVVADAKALNRSVQSAILQDLIMKAITDISANHTSAIDLRVLLSTLENDYKALKNRYQFEKSLFRAKYGNLNELSQNTGKVDSIYNNGHLTKLIMNAELLYSSTDLVQLDVMRDSLERATKDYYHTLQNKGTRISLKNGTFNGSNINWTNLSKNATLRNANGVSEFFAAYATDHTISFSQTLRNLNTGYYLIKSQAFERNGDNDHSGRDHREGIEQIHMTMTANDRSCEIQSLYAVPYTGPNSLYGFADGTASVNSIFASSEKNYSNYLLVYVNNGMLSVGLRKETTAVTSSNWSVFDNFEVYYLGEGIVETSVKPFLKKS